MNSAAVDKSAGDFGPGLRPVEMLVVVYLVLTGILAFVRREYLPIWPSTLAIHAVAIAVLVWLSRFEQIASTPLALVRRLVPLVGTAWFYGEVADLNDVVFPGRYFDPEVIAWEDALLGTQLAITLREAVWNKVLSEYLHFAYFAYYAVGFILVIPLILRQQWARIEESLTVVAVCFFTCMLWYIIFPVAGPYYEFTPPDPDTMGWVFPQIVNAVLEAGASKGAAFPSSHVAVSCAVYAMAWRHDRRAFWILTGIVPALVMATMYGGFHYGVDAIGGLIWCALCVAVGIPVHRWLNRRRTSGAGD